MTATMTAADSLTTTGDLPAYPRGVWSQPGDGRHEVLAGWVVEWDGCEVSLWRCPTGEPEAQRSFHSTPEKAAAEFERLFGVLLAAAWGEFAADSGLAPAGFAAAVAAGDLTALGAAADWHEEAGDFDRALLCRAALCVATGRANVAVPAGGKAVGYLNPVNVTKRTVLRRTPAPVRVTVLTPGEGVRVLSVTGDGEYTDRRFAVGDPCEYHSWNLVYVGRVVKVTGKQVVVSKDDSLGGQKANMSPGTFTWKNHDFDLAKARRRNAEWMD